MRYRVKGVQKKIRFLGSEFVAMMVRVSSAICVSSGTKGEPAEKVYADEVVDHSVRKEKSVGAFMAQNKHSVLKNSYYRQRENYCYPMIEGRDRPDHPDRQG